MSVKEDLTVDKVYEFDEYGFAIFKPGTTNAEDDDRCHQYEDEVSLGKLSRKAKTWKKISDSLHDRDGHFMSPHNRKKLATEKSLPCAQWTGSKVIYDVNPGTFIKCFTHIDPGTLPIPDDIRIPEVSFTTLCQSIKCGVPKEIRGKLWNLLLDTQAIQANASFNYQIMLEEIRCLLVDLGVSEYGGRNCIQCLGYALGKLNNKNKEKDDTSPSSLEKRRAAKAELKHRIVVFRQIMLDLERSFPTHQRFMDDTNEGKEGRASLFRVLAIYSQYNKTVSYCQGMSYIVGMLLMNMDEEKAFWCLVSLFERPKYLMGYFDTSLDKIQQHALVFEVIMKQRKNTLFKHLDNHGIKPLMYLTPWFMALFTSLPCWDTVLFIWDMFILQGVTVIFQVALALLEVLSDSLMSTSEMCQTLPILLHPPAELTKRKRIVPVILQSHVQKWEIQSIQAVLTEKKGKQVSKKRINKDKENSPSHKRLKVQKSENSKKGKPVSVFHEPPIINRIVDYLAVPLKNAFFGNSTNVDHSKEIEMATFSSTLGEESPFINTEGCFKVGQASPLSSDSNLFVNAPSAHNRYTKRFASLVKKSPRLLAKRRMQMKCGKKDHKTSNRIDSPSSMNMFLPDFSFTPDLELMEFNQVEKS